MTYTLPNSTNLNSSAGVDSLLTFTADAIPMFFTFFLFAYFAIVFFGTYFGYVRKGKENPGLAFVTAGFMTSILAMLMTLQSGLISGTILTVYCILTIFGVIWYMSSPE